VNLGNPAELTIRKFAEEIRRMTEAESALDFQPLPEDDPKQRKPDIAKARRILGWEPRVALADGIRLTVEYFRALQSTAA
jgi:dTDP-glucose 4,6-dehydratase